MNQQLYRRFDEPVNRVNTECIKWDNRKNFGNADALPMWVADMDFRTADGIVDALTARVAHGVFGYCQDSERDRAAVVNWMKTRHHTDVSPEWALYSPGVVDSIYHILRGLYREGARVVIQPAGVRAVPRHDREGEDGVRGEPASARRDRLAHGLRELRGLPARGRGRDHDLLAAQPRGARVDEGGAGNAGFAVQDVSYPGIICDEIHADFELAGAAHTPILSVPGAEDAVMMISATKTFNLAALRHSTILWRGRGGAQGDCGQPERRDGGDEPVRPPCPPARPTKPARSGWTRCFAT